MTHTERARLEVAARQSSDLAGLKRVMLSLCWGVPLYFGTLAVLMAYRCTAAVLAVIFLLPVYHFLKLRRTARQNRS